MYTIAVMNQKGGVGKTTTAHAIGRYLADKEYSVLYVDLDPQSNLSFTLGRSGGAFETLLDPTKIEANIQRTDRIREDVLAATPALVGADAALDEIGKEYKLKEALATLQAPSLEYDYCIIDTPPALGILSVNALTAADGLIIPVQADIYSLQGLSQISSTIAAVKAYTNADLTTLGILITRANERTTVRRELADILQKHAQEMHTSLFNTRIRECTAIVEAQANKENILDYAPKSNAAQDYNAFVVELLHRIPFSK